MKTLHSFLNESVTSKSSLSDITKFIEDSRKAGSISKQDWDSSKTALTKHLEKEWDNFSNDRRVYDSKITDYDAFDKSPMSKLSYRLSPNISQIDGLKKQIDAARAKAKKDPFYNEALVKRFDQYYQLFADVCHKHTDLKSNVVTAGSIRTAQKAAAESSFKQKAQGATVIIKALMTQIEDAKKVAKDHAEAYVDSTWKDLEKKNWDIKDDIERAKSSRGRDTVLNVYLVLTEVDPRSKTKNTQLGGSLKFDSRFRVKSESGRQRFIKDAIDGAEADYMKYVHKMVEKVGPGIADANVTGHPWTNSVLTVSMTDGTKQVWNTKMIVNYSVYGKAFNQFPSRQKK